MAFASFSMYEALVKLQWTQTQSTLFGAHRSGSDRNDWVDNTLELGKRRGGGLSRSPAVVGNLAQRRLNPNPSLLPGPGKTRPRGRPPYVPAAPAPSPSVGACVDLIEVPAGHPVQQARGVSQFCGPFIARKITRTPTGDSMAIRIGRRDADRRLPRPVLPRPTPGPFDRCGFIFCGGPLVVEVDLRASRFGRPR